MPGQRELEAEKGRAIREYCEYLERSLKPGGGNLDPRELELKRQKLIDYGIDPDQAAQIMSANEVQYQRGLAAWKTIILIGAVAGAIYWFFF